MEDFDFDKTFSEKMRRADVPDLSEEDWERLSPRLDQQQQRRWRMLPLWWLGALTGLLLVSNLGWFWMFKQSEKRAETMQTEWQKIQRETVTLHDTTFQKTVVYQYDTIYRTVVFRQKANPVFDENQEVFGLENIGKSGQGKLLNLEKWAAAENRQGQNEANFGVEKTSKITTEKKLTEDNRSGFLALLPTKTIFLETPQKHRILPENDFVITPLNREPRPFLLTPRSFRIGAGGGAMFPNAENLSKTGGYSTFLTGEIVFSDRLAMTLEGAFGGIGFRGNVYDEKLGLPPSVPPGDDYLLKYFKPHEGFKPIFQMTAGMRYWLKPAQKFSPYFGLGYAAQWHPGFELEENFTHQITGAEKSQEVHVPALGKTISFLDMNLGLRYRFSQHWFWQTGAAYQFKIDKNQPGIPRFWGLKSAVLYGF